MHLHAGAIIAVHRFGVVLGVVADFSAGCFYVEYVVGVVGDDVVMGAGAQFAGARCFVAGIDE